MSLSEFFAQGGYAFYVWGSYLVTLVVLGGEVLLLIKRKRALRQAEQLAERSTRSH